MENTTNTDTNSNSNDDVIDDERLILNVGGIKYETHRSTLIAYPDTFLGVMFQQRNNAMLKSNSDNPNQPKEYFFDRNGREFDYFQIPIPTNPYPPASATINHFILTLQRIIHEMEANLMQRVEIIFPWQDKTKFNLSPDLETIREILTPFITVTGYNILEGFGDDIVKYLMKNTPGFFCSLREREPSGNYPPRFAFVMQLPMSAFPREIRNGTFLVELGEDEENHEDDEVDDNFSD
ncbi:6647_t:CDS:2 [Ambispora gerdemannii]|uniref:6647_t:CDS:1 n=1 Tax=Ambispora gerdemannii TaxID=144530 RepID=A0A9N9ERR9_9GLOM|nr:6647_t:CDS:2 [Ambispora gerdemannii]